MTIPRPDHKEQPQLTPTPLTPENITGLELPALPLVIDLDGTLIPFDLTWQCTKTLFRRYPQTIWKGLYYWIAKGRVPYKEYVCRPDLVPVQSLPLHPTVMALITHWHTTGQPVLLATGSPASYVAGLVAHLGCFTASIASCHHDNRIGMRKATLLNTRWGKGQYIYVGNSRQDFPVWENAAMGILVGQPLTWHRFCKKGARIHHFITAPSL